jgi:hypothetical protein
MESCKSNKLLTLAIIEIIQHTATEVKTTLKRTSSHFVIYKNNWFIPNSNGNTVKLRAITEPSQVTPKLKRQNLTRALLKAHKMTFTRFALCQKYYVRASRIELKRH